MKAADYFDKYGERIMSSVKEEDYKKEVVDLFREFNNELKDMQELRHVESASGIAALILELNQKWNALTNLFIKKYGVSPISVDGFKRYWIESIPDLARHTAHKRK